MNRPAQGAEIRVFPDVLSMSRAAADIIVTLANRKVAEHGRFTIALSGGSTPKYLYSLFASSPYRQALPWRNMHVFWADERCVPADDPESNYKLAFDAFLSAVSVPAEQIHRIRGEEKPEIAAIAYEEELRSVFGNNGIPVFDLMLLGLGEDGHTASLFPGSAAIRERKRLALPVYVEAPGLSRVTLTFPVLNNAAKVLFLVEGRVKATVVHEILQDGNPKHYPAGLVQPVHGSFLWLLDHEAAGTITETIVKKYI